MTTTSVILGLLLGLGLSASTGLNTFLPLLLLSGAARFNFVELGERFQWLSSDTAIVVLMVACIVEIVADKVPAVDHFLDSIGTFVRPVAGTVAMASVLTGLDPTVAAVVGIMLGAPTALGLHTLKAGARVTSSATTFGCANPVLSLIEDLASLCLSLLAIFAPIVVPVALLALVFVLWRVFKRMRAAPPTAPVRSAP